MRISTFVRMGAAACVAVGLASAVSNAFAETSADVFDVEASVIKNCKVTTAPVTFSDYDVFATADTDNQGGLTIACTKGVPAIISLSGSNATRKMTGPGGAQLTYGLYQNAGRTTGWDATTTVNYASVSRATTTLTVYARIPKDQDVPVGAYSDEVTATINF
jgi:spore coat protein U-like protein